MVFNAFVSNEAEVEKLEAVLRAEEAARNSVNAARGEARAILEEASASARGITASTEAQTASLITEIEKQARVLAGTAAAEELAAADVRLRDLDSRVAARMDEAVFRALEILKE